MQKLRCVIERITYQNPENGYSVMKVKVKDYSDLVTLVGNLLEIPVGSVLLCEGEWKVDKRYGNQFVVQTWEEDTDCSSHGKIVMNTPGPGQCPVAWISMSVRQLICPAKRH